MHQQQQDLFKTNMIKITKIMLTDPTQRVYVLFETKNKHVCH